MEEAQFAARLAALGERLFGERADITGLRRFSGGANMESWGFDHGARPLVLRRMPAGSERSEAAPRLSIESEAALIALAGRHGVTAPAIHGVLEAADGLGEGFVMARVDGESLPHKILDNPDYAAAERALPGQCAAELARIHALPRAQLPTDMPEAGAADLLADLHQRYRNYGAEIAIYDFAFCWLADNLPDPVEPHPLHGDFRMGNLLIDLNGISAVLDWELAHLGDPVQDLAYLCTPSWRFTRHDRSAGGFGSIDKLLAAYEESGGAPVDRDRFGFWLIYNTLWWGGVCLNMIDIWRTGLDRSLERTVIGRRTSEVEVDLLLLFDPLLGEAARTRIVWDEPTPAAPTGPSHGAELLEALDDWASDAVIPAAHGRARFEARVARNALGILEREARLGPVFAERRAARLADLCLTFAGLRAGLADGSLTPRDPAILAHLRLSALERLSIDQPKYPALTAALAAWTE